MELTIKTKKFDDVTITIDADDFEFLKGYNLTVIKAKTGKFYVMTSDKQYLHRLLLNAPKGYHVHHINGDTLDNRRSNLALLKPKEHALETAKTKNKKLSEADIKSILKDNSPNRIIANKFNISDVLVSQIKTGKQYSFYCPDIKRAKTKNHSRRTIEELKQIKKQVLMGKDLKELSAIFNMSIKNLYRMRNGKAYKNIKVA